IAMASGEQRGRWWCRSLRAFGAVIFSASPGNNSKQCECVADSFGAGQPQRPERIECGRWRRRGVVGGKLDGAVAETLERLSEALPAAFAAAADMGEVDFERDHLAAAAGLVDHLAA